MLAPRRGTEPYHRIVRPATGKGVFLARLRLDKVIVCGAERNKLLIHQVVKGEFLVPPLPQPQRHINRRMANDNLAKGIVCMLDMFLIF